MPPRMANTPAKFQPGDMWKGWTVVRLIADGPRSTERQWIIQCGCGYTIRRWENEFTTRMTTCATCAGKEKAGKKNG